MALSCSIYFYNWFLFFLIAGTRISTSIILELELLMWDDRKLLWQLLGSCGLEEIKLHLTLNDQIILVWWFRVLCDGWMFVLFNLFIVILEAKRGFTEDGNGWTKLNSYWACKIGKRLQIVAVFMLTLRGRWFAG